MEVPFNEERVPVDEDEATHTSSSPVSTPPKSPPLAGNTTLASTTSLFDASNPNNNLRVLQQHNLSGNASAEPKTQPSPPTTTTHTTTTSSTTAATVRKPRKKKDPSAAAAGADGKPKEPIQRKPRTTKPKDASATTTTTTTGARKKQKTTDAPHDVQRQSTIPELVPGIANPSNSAFMPPRSTYTEPPPEFRLSAGPTTPRPISSGQHYDPIRSATVEPIVVSKSSATCQVPSPPRFNKASASPTIASLIDPPMVVQNGTMTPIMMQAVRNQAQTSATSTHHPMQQHSFALFPTSNATSPSDIAIEAPNLKGGHRMEIDHETTPQPFCLIKEDVTPVASRPASEAPTPKAVRPKETPPPLPSGSGLLSADLTSATNGSSGRLGVDIDIQIKLDPRGGNTINMAQEITKKYGRDALNPRAAAHRERLLQVAAAAGRLEKSSTSASADDMSVDITSEPENDSYVEMGGMDDGEGVASGEKPKRKRKKKIEEYDKEDDFIDDTEMAWEEQRAVAKDGFFVYSGPLVTDEPKAADRTDAPPKRGRGRGRGGAGAAAGATHASVRADSATATTTGAAPTRRGRGGGPGSRGGQTGPRKPRVPKAEKEREKLERERVEVERAAAANAAAVAANAGGVGSGMGVGAGGGGMVVGGMNGSLGVMAGLQMKMSPGAA
ncbi:HIR complex subunit, partial [Cryomyces antarcticus]